MQIVRQLRVEAEPDDPSFAHTHRAAVLRGKDLSRPHVLYQWSSNEDAWKIAAQGRDLDRSLKALHLAAVAVSAEDHVEEVEPALIGTPAGDLAGQEYQPRAGGESRETGPHACRQRFPDLLALEQDLHGRALSTREDEAVETIEILGQAHPTHGSTRPMQSPAMLAEVSLESEDAYGRAGCCDDLLPPSGGAVLLPRSMSPCRRDAPSVWFHLAL